jgi:hypothetical protein
MVRVFAFILKVKGSNLTSGVCMINIGKLTKYFHIIPYNGCLGWLHGLRT